MALTESFYDQTFYKQENSLKKQVQLKDTMSGRETAKALKKFGCFRWLSLSWWPSGSKGTVHRWLLSLVGHGDEDQAQSSHSASSAHMAERAPCPASSSHPFSALHNTFYLLDPLSTKPGTHTHTYWAHWCLCICWRPFINALLISNRYYKLILINCRTFTKACP